MVNKFAFEALDRTLRDIMRFSTLDSTNKEFDEKTVVLGEDFCQILFQVLQDKRLFLQLSTHQLYGIIARFLH